MFEIYKNFCTVVFSFGAVFFFAALSVEIWRQGQDWWDDRW